VGKLLLLLVLVAGCSQRHVVDAPLPATDPTRLSHEQHAQVPCVSCHRSDARPGKNDHAPCDTCHAKDFLGAPGPLCKVCHTAVTAMPLVAPLRRYPVADAWQAEPSRFSHRLHLDAGRMESRVGFHVACADCHVRDGQLARPNHATCARCHAPEAAPARSPTMTDCERCHDRGAHQRSRARLIRDDLKFTHAQHTIDRKGVAIRCEDCHAASTRSQSYADHPPPRIESCVACHDDTDRTPGELRMRACQVCHTSRRQSLTAIAPRNHLPATERPLDHTLAFRRDHTDAAERDSARCAACHTQMSGNPRDACDECHQTMLPSDHRITWRELDHGTEAAADRERCARCHVVEFCTACHSQRPRSHGFGTEFSKSHGELARINVRSCLTCHEQRTCIGPGCHAD
jgi:hypothetical protein